MEGSRELGVKKDSNLASFETAHCELLTYIQVLWLSQFLLLHTASPDALIRLKRTPLEDQADKLSQVYDCEQCHSSLKEFLSYQLTDDTEEGGKLMQVSMNMKLQI